jgi:hypothetical protein
MAVLQRHAYLIPTVAGQQLLAAMHMLASHSRLEARLRPSEPIIGLLSACLNTFCL